MAVSATIAAVAVGTTAYTTTIQKQAEDKANRQADDAKLALEREKKAMQEADATATAKEQADMRRASDQARKRALSSYDRSQTILTGPQGLGNNGQAPGASKTLLGT